MVDELQRVKELFILYRGHFIQMHRAGYLEEYKKYDISKQTEIDWYNELIDTFSKQLSIRDWEAVTSLEALAKYYEDDRMLEHVISFVSRHIMGADSMVKLMYAEKIIDFVKSSKKPMPKEFLYKVCRITVQILEDIISKPLIIDPGHELDVFNLKDKKSLNNRAKKSIGEIENILS
ncbi:hypothetical protein GK047_11845 [Paenibacillus sp. SYP-B3998]|uniref:Uncharacterized protein n=1 Tax=Paenibacillus sp. SYP-B3998 TaxID=2678564 RepID=A0A6G3ZZ77_9BACL|nr:hypothetical protein [Paenibacillus sp. SYP-B3998]NEW06707.1 hypothetical protein [Paenibacillus sp. SYP-B3998]